MRQNDCSLLSYSSTAFYISAFKGMYFSSSALLCLHPTAISIFHRAQNCSHSYKNASAVWDLLRWNKKCMTWENTILYPEYWFHGCCINRNCPLQELPLTFSCVGTHVLHKPGVLGAHLSRKSRCIKGLAWTLMLVNILHQPSSSCNLAIFQTDIFPFAERNMSYCS